MYRDTNAFDEGFRREWFLRPEMREVDRACYAACGMSLHTAWTNERGCYVRGSWISPSQVARAIAGLVFDWEEW